MAASNEQLGEHVRSLDWNNLANLICTKLRLEIARHPKTGPALTFEEGDALIGKLTSEIIYTIHRQVDPEYDA
jgi:hypothetical protein